MNENFNSNAPSTPFSLNKNFKNLFDKCILMEYKYVQKFCPLGIYIIPDYNNIKDGLYQKGVFKFVINIPEVYPSEIPQIFFLNKIIHPLVDKQTGKLDLKKKFTSWKPGKNLIIHIIFFLKNIFYNPKYLQETDSYNPECSKMFTEDHNKFKEEINKICELAFEEKNTNKNKTEALNQIFLDKVSQQNKNVNLSSSDKIKELKKWFIESFVEIVKDGESK